MEIMKRMSKPKSAAVKDIDINIADILGKKYPYCINIDKCSIDPFLAETRHTENIIIIIIIIIIIKNECHSNIIVDRLQGCRICFA